MSTYDFEPAPFTENDDGVTCLRCGAPGLYWQEVITADGKPAPRLFEDGKAHVCKPSADDFEDLTT